MVWKSLSEWYHVTPVGGSMEESWPIRPCTKCELNNSTLSFDPLQQAALKKLGQQKWWKDAKDGSAGLGRDETKIRFFTSHCSQQVAFLFTVVVSDFADVGCKCDAPGGACELEMHGWWCRSSDVFGLKVGQSIASQVGQFKTFLWTMWVW